MHCMGDTCAVGIERVILVVRLSYVSMRFCICVSMCDAVAKGSTVMGSRRRLQCFDFATDRGGEKQMGDEGGSTTSFEFACGLGPGNSDIGSKDLQHAETAENK